MIPGNEAVNETDVVILCGGKGSRLRPLTDRCPKSMIEVAGRPFLEILVEQIADQGFDRALLCTGYLGEVIRDYFSGYAKVKIDFSQENTELGTGGGLKLAGPRIRGSSFLVLNGDSYCGVDLRRLMAFHASRRGYVTMTIVPQDASRADAGLVSMNEKRQIVGFQEKGLPRNGYINAGIYAIERRLLDKIPEGRFSSLERDIFPHLSPCEIFAFVTDRRLYDIGTGERLEIFRQAYQRRKGAGFVP